MGWGIEEVMDRIMVGGGYARGNGEGAAVGKASVSAIVVAEEKVETAYGDVPGRSFFALGGLEGTCAYQGNCKVGVDLGVGFVPGILGAFAGPKFGASYSPSDGRKEGHLGFELDVLDPISPVTEMWALEGRVTMNFDDRSLGFGVFLTVGGSATKAVQQR
jgi:hypothetical protein